LALTVTDDFANSGSLDLDIADAGGGSLMIDGTLTNNGSTEFGWASTRPVTVTLGGLVNNSGASFVMGGSASQAATLSFSPSGPSS
jgi:hypothetical protein